MEEQIGTKQNDIENNNSQLSELQKKLNNLVNECEIIYNDYEDKKNKVRVKICFRRETLIYVSVLIF